MVRDITAGIVRIDSGNTFGTGFVVSDDGLIATCAHVVGRPDAEKVIVTFQYNHQQREARVEVQWWRGVDAEDIALLRVDGGLPQGVCSLPLGSSTDVSDHEISTFGFAVVGDVTGGISCSGKVVGRQTKTNTGQPLIQLRSNEITSGHSGAPVWDKLRQRVIGMIVEAATADRNNKLGDTAFATPTETLRNVCTTLQISHNNPYRGLNAFTEAEVTFFFGRTQEVERLTHRLLNDPRFLVVQGPSGSGKSSLVQAGLIPRLRSAAIPGSDRWHIYITRPAANPFQDLATQGLAGASNNLVEAVQKWLSQHPEQPRIVLVIDQFEEMLLDSSEEGSPNFLQQLTTLLDANLATTIIVVMRDDFSGQLAQNARMVEWQTQCGGAIDIPPTLREEDLLAIVQEPARAIGLPFEDGLVDQIVSDAIEKTTAEDGDMVVGRTAVLPLLEFALTELCERSEDGMLTFEAYKNMGGVTGSLRQWADTTYNSLEDQRKKQLVQRIFTDLVSLGDESEQLPDSCRHRLLESLYRDEGEREEVYKLVQRLVNARLLVTSQDVQSKKVTVEIIHEALLHEWPLLKWWLKQDRPFLLWHQDFEKRTQVWAESNPAETRYVDVFLQGSSLTEAERWMEQRAADLSQGEKDFIKACRERQDRQDLRKAQERKEVMRQREVALAHQLSAQAQLLFDQQGYLLQRSILLAAEALQRIPSEEANHALRHGLALLPRPISSLAPGDGVSVVALSSDGWLLLRANSDMTVEVWDITHQLQLVRLNHEVALKAAIFNVNGSCFATIGANNVVYVWETTSGRQLAHLHNESSVNAITFNQNGRYLATTTDDGSAWVWEVMTNRLLARLPHEGIVHAVAFSPDGRYLATASGDGNARVWEPTTGRLLDRFNHGCSVDVVTFSPDERYLATVSDDYNARLWVLGATKGQQPVLLSHDDTVNALAFSPDRTLATASKDRSVRIWERSSGRLVTRMTHEGSISAIAFSLDGRYLATTSTDRTVGVWEASSGYRLVCLPHKDVDYKDVDYIHAIAFSADGRKLVTASRNGSARVWEITNTRLTHKRSVNAITYSPDGSYLATASEDDTAGVWEAASGYRHLLLSHGSKLRAVVFSPHGRYLVTAGEDGMVRVWQTADGSEVWHVVHKQRVNAVAYSPDGRYLATASADRTAGIWDVVNARLLVSLPHNDCVNAVAYSPDGRYLATACSDGYGRLWEMSDQGRDRPHAYLPHKLTVHSIVFNSDGRYVATASEDHTANIWETTRGRQIQSLPHNSAVGSVVFSPIGTLVATASQDGTAAVWEIPSGKQIARLDHDGGVNAIAFSQDGKYVATASEDRIARVWELSSSSQFAYLTHDDGVNAITFSPDGQYVSSASRDGTARLWLWRAQDLISEACTRLTRNLTAAEWQHYLVGEPYRKTCPNLVEVASADW